MALKTYEIYVDGIGFADTYIVKADIYFNETFCEYFGDIDILYIENFSVV